MSWNPEHLVNSLRSASSSLMRAQTESVQNHDGDAPFLYNRIKNLAEQVAGVLGDAINLAVKHAATAMTDPPDQRYPGPEWYEFLIARAKAIGAMAQRGYAPSDIVRMVNVLDENHVHAISITATSSKT